MDESDELFSDESSFYGRLGLRVSIPGQPNLSNKVRTNRPAGSESEKENLEDLVATFDPSTYWSEVHPHLLSTVQHKLRSESTPTTRPFTTEDIKAAGPWIYAYNPYRNRKGEGLPSLLARGTKLLQKFENKKADFEYEHAKSKSKSTVGLARKVNPLRRTLEKDIFALARETGVVSGKWMLFPSPREVDRYWAAISRATVQGELGIAAKVAIHDTENGNSKSRLIAVYTRDYEDRDDVRRVLGRLMDMGLVWKEDRPIYYKSDALTYLEVKADNPYGLKASLFSSRDMITGKI